MGILPQFILGVSPCPDRCSWSEHLQIKALLTCLGNCDLCVSLFLAWLLILLCLWSSLRLAVKKKSVIFPFPNAFFSHWLTKTFLSCQCSLKIIVSYSGLGKTFVSSGFFCFLQFKQFSKHAIMFSGNDKPFASHSLRKSWMKALWTCLIFMGAAGI